MAFNFTFSCSHVLSLHLNLKYLGGGCDLFQILFLIIVALWLSHSPAASLGRFSCVISGHWIREGMTFTLPASELSVVSSVSHGDAVRGYFYHPVMLRKLGPWSRSFLSQKGYSLQIPVLRVNQSMAEPPASGDVRGAPAAHLTYLWVTKGNLTPVQASAGALQVGWWDVRSCVKRRAGVHPCYSIKAPPATGPAPSLVAIHRAAPAGLSEVRFLCKKHTFSVVPHGLHGVGQCSRAWGQATASWVCPWWALESEMQWSVWSPRSWHLSCAGVPEILWTLQNDSLRKTTWNMTYIGFTK